MPKKGATNRGVPRPTQKRIVKTVKRVLARKEETKNVTYAALVAAASAVTNSTGAVINLQQIAQGLNVNDRIGDIIEPKLIKIRYEWLLPVATVSSFFRVMIVQTMQQPTAAVFATSEVLATVGTAQVTSSQIATASASNNRFKILFDKVHANDIYGKGLLASGTITLRKKLPSKIHFNGAASTDYGKNCLFMLIFSNQNTAQAPAFNYAIQHFYKDA